jgi:hypothetical protein
MKFGMTSRLRDSCLTFGANLSLAFQITLVTHDDDGEIILIFDSQNLLLESQDFLKTLSTGYAVYQQKPFTSSHVLLSHCTIFFLSSGI